ncbi:20S-pre-rRNA D-site endonuclease nob1 [Dispira parvispora]|uniref:20S-pre-rRNA D-site endonuclease NOB1 n=1 Tax=Dispira parvispora TaxID=1520584 RepID=A0A9W8AVN3_9FUNG|nr:20S-pre-rRNA D-site endonuclease nob1 [Dispira parvispora]
MGTLAHVDTVDGHAEQTSTVPTWVSDVESESDTDSEEVSDDESVDLPLRPSTTSSGDKPFVHLVLDTNPFFHSLSDVGQLADKFYTVPDVIGEIRSAKHRSQLMNNVYFDLEVREPSAADMRAVVEFSKKTGDFASISLTDTKILALTYSLEREIHGGVGHLATEPRSSSPGKSSESNSESQSSKQEEVKDLVTRVDKLHLGAPQSSQAPSSAFRGSDFQVVDKIIADDDEDDDDDDGWITPSNLKAKNLEFSGGATETQTTGPIPVACITADFAMQNVILQMGMKLGSMNGAHVTQLRTQVLRCYSCSKVVTDLEKKFCPDCGNATLTRVSASVDEKGGLKLYLKHNYHYNLRGKRFSIPKPKGGKKHTDLVFREDQKEFQRAYQMKSGHHKSTTNIFDEDFIPRLLSSGVSEPVVYNLSDKVGYGRRNPNMVKHTGNRKKKKDRR